MSESPRPPRLGREATPLMLPTSHRVKKKRRSRSLKVVVVGSVFLLVLSLATAFVSRDRIRKHIFPPPKMTNNTPRTR